MADTAPRPRRERIRRVLKGMPASLPAGLAALAVLTDNDDPGLPVALKWGFLLLFLALLVTDLITGGRRLAHRRHHHDQPRPSA